MMNLNRTSSPFQSPKRLLAALIAGTAAAVALALPTTAGAAPGDLLVADINAPDGGGLIRASASTGAENPFSSNPISQAAGGSQSFEAPAGIVFAPNGDMYVSDVSAFGGPGGVIRVSLQTGAQTPVSSNAISQAAGGAQLFDSPQDLTIGPDNALYVVDSTAFADGQGGVIRVDPQTGKQSAVTSNAISQGAGGVQHFESLTGLAFGPDGKLYVSDQTVFNMNGAVIRVDPQTGKQTDLSSNPISLGVGGEQDFESPVGVLFDSNGKLYVVDRDAFGSDGGIINVDAQTGKQTALSNNVISQGAGGTQSFVNPEGLVPAPNGDFYVVDTTGVGGGGGVIRVSSQTGKETPVSSNAISQGAGGTQTFSFPRGLAVEPVLPASAAGQGGSSGGATAGSGALRLEVGRTAKQKGAKRGRVLISATCRSVNCSLTARSTINRLPVGSGRTGRFTRRATLKRVDRQAPESVRKTIKLKLSKKLRSDIRLAIKRGRKPRVKVRVTAVDSRGNAITKRVGVTVTG